MSYRIFIKWALTIIDLLLKDFCYVDNKGGVKYQYNVNKIEYLKILNQKLNQRTQNYANFSYYYRYRYFTFSKKK